MNTLFTAYSKGFSTADEADQHRKKLMHPDEYGVFGIWSDDFTHSLWCIMPKAALEILQPKSEIIDAQTVTKIGKKWK